MKLAAATALSLVAMSGKVLPKIRRLMLWVREEERSSRTIAKSDIYNAIIHRRERSQCSKISTATTRIFLDKSQYASSHTDFMKEHSNEQS